MTETIRVKLRQIGSSVGVLIPREQLRIANVDVGDEMEIALLTHKKDFSGFGMAKNFKIPFTRDKKTREF